MFRSAFPFRVVSTLAAAILFGGFASHGPRDNTDLPDFPASASACAAGTICVGPGQTYGTLADALLAARPGSLIEIAGGTYREAVTITVGNLTIRGIGSSTHIDCTGLPLAGNKACLLLAAGGITLENLDIGGAVLPEDRGANGACIRNEPNLDFTLRRISCHASQDGILTNGGKVVIEDSEFYDNGWTGQTHNVYFSGRCPSVIVRRSIFRDARVGHEFKSRCARTEIYDSTFVSTKGSRNLDIPDGGETIVSGSTLYKMPGSESQQIIGFTPESCTYPGDMLVRNTRIVNTMIGAEIQNFDRCPGKAIIFQHISVEGLPVKDVGTILGQ